ncbi:nitrite reductase large subunit NirB [Halobacillus sp. A5]|uniref:nitrite reductase large subunit NirB n=1 Tax=Halobacillus sp. A5 TaxID=2880263 RepID=UPI0020A642DA|nr:nitrite reductase large subunit NirB [Halobacillus sp. A5]MCP3028337.1 nitrite reductase large subunit NirB [Halobacillus sp. A5]
MKKQRLVVIGNGMAAIRFVRNLLKEDPDFYNVVMFGSEPHTSYSRIMLSSVLQGDTTVDDITIQPCSWYEENNIQLFTGETVLTIDKDDKKLVTDKSREVTFDKLVIATGSSPFILPIAGNDKEGVIAFRTIKDCERMMETAEKFSKAVVIGGGLLGLEAARGLVNLGMKTDVVHISKYIMERQLDKQASLMLQEQLEEQGMNFLLKKVTEEIIGEDRVKAVRFKDGTTIEADLVVMAAGVRPNIKLAEESGIQTGRGIIVNDHLQTSEQDIYAVGECVEHNGNVYGLVQPLYEQAEVLAKHLCRKSTGGYKGSLLYTQLKISGVHLFSAGEIQPGSETKAIHYYNEVDSIYKKIVFQGNKAVGTVMFGDTRAGPAVLDTIVKQKPLSSKDKSLLLESPDPQQSPAASYSLEKHICSCNSVSKGTIIQAVQQRGLTTVPQVRECTKAASSCGGCKPLVSDLLDYIKSDGFDEGVIDEPTLCSCTGLTEDELVEQIQIQNLSSAEEVMVRLGWLNLTGCSTCRLALDYYLGMIHPEYSTDRKEDVFINDYMNAKAQQDGSYAVVPQLYGGEVTIEQLKNITQTAEKFNISNMAVASDQRIHLLGINKQDLRSVWNMLDMPLRAPYGNRVEPVKTNIGNHDCQCHKQSALNIARAIEKKTELLQTPYRLKIGISSCIHNGAGSTTKDIGAIKVDGSWEMYIGGSSGRNARKGQLLCIAEDDIQLERMILGCLQYYRKSARYLERTWQWMDRLSLIHIREALFNEELCEELIRTLSEDAAIKKEHLIKA